MIDSSLTTPLPHLKSLHSYGWISSERLPWPGESPELDTQQKKVSELCHAGTRLYIKPTPS